MNNLLKSFSCLILACVALAGCSGSASPDAPKVPRYAAHLYVLSDVSGILGYSRQ